MTDETTDVTRRAVLAALGGTTVGTAGVSARPTAAADPAEGCPGTGTVPAPAPGPDVLYEDPVAARQLEPGGRWTADPLLVSGSEAYVDGEYLYQGWVHDDHGAVATEGNLVEQPLATEIDAPEGDLVYPTDDERYRHNAADVLEVRVRKTDDGVAYRIALNTMVEGHEDAAAVAVGVDTGSGDRTEWGHGLGDLGAAVDTVVVAAGDEATVDGDAAVLSTEVRPDRNQLEVEVSLDPGRETWTHYAVAGVHDGDLGFADVQPQPTETEPGGAATDVPPVFDVAFRLDGEEPVRQPYTESAMSLPAEDPATGEVGSVGVTWREKAQARALADRDVSAFGADVDFGRLEDGVTDRRLADGDLADLPGRYLNRLYASRYEFGAGVSSNPSFGGTRTPETDGDATTLLGDVQPYSVYVPSSYEPGEPAPLHVMPHSLSFNYNQYAGTPNQLRQLGEERGAIVLMLQGRGPAGWWKDEAELDLFEAWNDLAARYDVDPDRVTIGGYSMGGYATYRLSSLYPDLFAAGFSVVGPADEDYLGGPSDGEHQGGFPRYTDDPQNTMRVTDNLRHVPLLLWAGTNDELVPYPGVRNYRRQLEAHGYRHRLDSFPGFDHFAHFAYDRWGPGREFLRDRSVERSPARVTYRAVPAWENDRFGFAYDGAYWVQDIEVALTADEGRVDAVSLAEGYGEPLAVPFADAGPDPAPNTREGVRWPARAAERAANAIELDCEGVAAVTLYVDETGVDATEPLTLRVETTHDLEVRLLGGAGEAVLEVPAGGGERTVTLCERGPGGGPSDRRPEGDADPGPDRDPDTDPDPEANADPGAGGPTPLPSGR